MALRRTPIKKVGKVGKANIEARKMIADKCEEIGLNRCELRLDGCLINWALAPAHRKKRMFYHGNAEELADYKQWVCACTPCHMKIENDEQLTEQIFLKLRGTE